MKRLYQNETKNQVLRGEYWDGLLSKSLLSKYRMNLSTDDKQTVEWLAMFIKTNGAVDPANLLSGVIDKQTGVINAKLFDYIPWYLGYRGTDFDIITSATYDPDELTDPLDMIAAQLTLETKKYNEKTKNKTDISYLELIEGKKEKEPEQVSPIWDLIEGTIFYEPKDQRPAYHLEDGMPQVYKPLRLQLIGPCLGIHNEVIDALKAYGYDNALYPDKVRYCGDTSVTVVMLTTLFVMYIIKKYFAAKASYTGNNSRRYAKLKIDSDRNKKMVHDEITEALKFEDRISEFWRAVKKRSGFTPWEYEHYNTLENTKEMLDRAEVVLTPNIDNFREDEHNDLGHFPGASLF